MFGFSTDPILNVFLMEPDRDKYVLVAVAHHLLGKLWIPLWIVCGSWGGGCPLYLYGLSAGQRAEWVVHFSSSGVVQVS